MLPFSQDLEGIKAAVLDRNSFATTLYAIALRLFGPEIHEWEPEMFDMEFRDEIGVDMPALNQSKLLALTTALATDSFQSDAMVFRGTCEILCGTPADLVEISPDTLPAELAWGVVEIGMNDPDDLEFSLDVAAYTGLVLDQFGFTSTPRPLEFAVLPDRYLGSHEPDAIGQLESTQTLHARLVDQYLKDQSSMLFDQLSRLPWVSEDLLGEVVGEIGRASFRTRVIPEPVL